MSNSTIKASGKLEKGIISTPKGSFLRGENCPSRFQQMYFPCKEPGAQILHEAEAQGDMREANPYDYSFDKMPS